MPVVEDLTVPFFLTAYDPSDLPGGSIDPLGFERGYLFLADKILPGLTNVANRPRYFSVLCAGAVLAGTNLNDAPRTQYQKRLESILRLERFWALANVLASDRFPDAKLEVGGIRGVTYATEALNDLKRSKARSATARFQLLSRQMPYGLIGIYGAVADGMRLIDRKSLSPTADLGERLGELFLEHTAVPPKLVKAVKTDGEVPLDELAEWGRRSHVEGEYVDVERQSMADALHRNPVRSRMSMVLADHPFVDERETELSRLSRLLPALRAQQDNTDLAEATTAILAYEEAYRTLMLAFERLLWLCRNLTTGSISPGDVAADQILQSTCTKLPMVGQNLTLAVDTSVTHNFRQDLDRLEDTCRFVRRAVAACNSPIALTDELLSRHADVQAGKFDKGKRKMPWLEKTGDRIGLTTTRVGGLRKEAADIEQIAPHPYRLGSADALIEAERII